MGINWKTPESKERLLASICAYLMDANGGKVTLDYKKMAFYFGQGATYDSIEGQFRLFKKAGKDLITEAETEGRSELPARGKSAPNTPRKPKAPKKAAGSQDGVMTGRVTKNASPKKGGKVKQEKFSSATSSFFADTPESMVDAIDGDDEMPFSETHGQFDDRFNPVSEFDELDLGLGI